RRHTSWPRDWSSDVCSSDLQEILHSGVSIEVDVLIWMAVARKEFFDAKRVGGMSRPEKHDISQPARNQLHSPKDERPHEDLAERSEERRVGKEWRSRWCVER